VYEVHFGVRRFVALSEGGGEGVLVQFFSSEQSSTGLIE